MSVCLCSGVSLSCYVCSNDVTLLPKSPPTWRLLWVELTPPPPPGGVFLRRRVGSGSQLQQHQQQHPPLRPPERRQSDRLESWYSYTHWFPMASGHVMKDDGEPIPRMQPAMMMFSSKYWSRRGLSLDSAMFDQQHQRQRHTGGQMVRSLHPPPFRLTGYFYSSTVAESSFRTLLIADQEKIIRNFLFLKFCSKNSKSN